MKTERFMRIVILSDHLGELLSADHFEASKLTVKRLQGEVAAYYEELKAPPPAPAAPAPKVPPPVPRVAPKPPAPVDEPKQEENKV